MLEKVLLANFSRAFRGNGSFSSALSHSSTSDKFTRLLRVVVPFRIDSMENRWSNPILFPLRSAVSCTFFAGNASSSLGCSTGVIPLPVSPFIFYFASGCKCLYLLKAQTHKHISMWLLPFLFPWGERPGTNDGDVALIQSLTSLVAPNRCYSGGRIN